QLQKARCRADCNARRPTGARLSPPPCLRRVVEEVASRSPGGKRRAKSLTPATAQGYPHRLPRTYFNCSKNSGRQFLNLPGTFPDPCTSPTTSPNGSDGAAAGGRTSQIFRVATARKVTCSVLPAKRI